MSIVSMLSDRILIESQLGGVWTTQAGGTTGLPALVRPTAAPRSSDPQSQFHLSTWYAIWLAQSVTVNKTWRITVLTQGSRYLEIYAIKSLGAIYGPTLTKLLASELR